MWLSAGCDLFDTAEHEERNPPSDSEMSHLVQHLRLEFGPTPAGEAWRYWQACTSQLFQAECQDREGFEARMDLYNPGPVVWSLGWNRPYRCTRSRRLIAANGLDHLLVQLVLSGRTRALAGGREMRPGPGDLAIVDMAHPWESDEGESEVLSLTLPRSLVEDELGPGVDLHGMVFGGGNAAGQILAEYLLAVQRRMGRVVDAEAPAIVEAALSLLVASLRPELSASARVRPALEQLECIRIRRYVQRNLLSPDLSAASIAEHFGISRTQLYLYFQADGGVLAFIRAMRLRRCFAALVDERRRGRSIREIAEQHGFACGPHFSRLFRRTFGLSPAEVRRAGRRQDEAPPAGDVETFVGWMRSLG